MSIQSHNNLNPHSLGHVYEDADVTVFFGNRFSGRESLTMSFPDYSLMLLNQTHSDVVVESPFTGPAPEADAHITSTKRVALCVRTADCLPVLIHDPEIGQIAAIHAGWRGIENGIILKTAIELKSRGSTLQRARAWIGPHIGVESFEVGRDVAQKLAATFEAVRGYSNEADCVHSHPDQEKARVDLLEIACAQLRASGIELERMTELAIDTVKSADHESFRRDRSTAGRQLSFICLK